MYATTPALWPALLAFLALSMPLAITDARESRLPLALNLALLGSGVVLLPVASLWTGVDHLIWSAVSFAIATLLMLILFVIARGGLGFGDVILVGGLSLYTGFASPLLMLTAIWVGAIATLGWMLVRRRRGTRGPVPFGPGLIVASLIALLLPVL